MYFSLQRRTNVQKRSETVSFLTFSLANVLLATAACNFSTSELQKMVRTWCVLYILTLKCASCYSSVPFLHIPTWKCVSRYSGVQFSDIRTSKSGPPLRCFVHFDLKRCFSTAACKSSTSELQKSGPNRRCFVHFDLKMCFSPQRRAISTSELQKVVRTCCVLCILTSKWASRYSGVQFSISRLNSYLRTRRFTKPTFRPSRPTNHWKNTAFRDFPNISRTCIFFLLTLLLLSAFSSSDSATLFCFFNCPYCRKLDF